jgi:predicted membrane channel-forming protein YqfA (hemolysin III family)
MAVPDAQDGETTDDLVGALAQALGGLQMAATSAANTATRSERNRLNLLHLHGAAGMYIGPLFAAIGPSAMTGPNWAILRAIPYMPYSVGALFFVGGFVLYEATTRRAKRTEIAGLCVMAASYVTIAVSFFVSVLLWLADWGGPFAPLLATIGWAEAGSLVLWTLRRRREWPHLALHLAVGWSIGFSLGIQYAPQPFPSWYAHGVYAHLAAILAIHLGTLIQKVRRGGL